jgi:SAM-dependent methyltransferase
MVLGALTSRHVAADARILDVGCGDGALSGLLAIRTKAQIEGIDVEPLSIELARQEFARRGLAGRFTLIDGYDYPFEDGSFSAVVCSDAIEHVQKPEAMLAEMWRVLAPGGRLVVTTPVRYTEIPRDPLHVQEWFPEEFRQLCSRVLGVPVELTLSHPLALAEIYALPTWSGRVSRLVLNAMAKLGRQPFTRPGSLRSCSTQTVVAEKPA